MNRTWNKLGKTGVSLVCLAVALVLAVGCLADVAHAGDGDGITGYSIRLKNKNFDGSDGFTGGELAVTPGTEATGLLSFRPSHQDIGVARLRLVFLVDWHWFFRSMNLR